MDYQEIWWNKVPSASELVHHAAGALLDWKTVAVNNMLGEWTETFVDAVTREIRANNFSTAFFELDLQQLSESSRIMDGIADHLSIGYMMKRTVSNLLPELPKAGSIWVLKHMDERRFSEMRALLQEISQCRAPMAFIFVKPTAQRLKGSFDADLSFSNLDLQYYAWTLMMGRQQNHLLEYASQLAVELCAGMPERCARLCAHVQQLVTAPESLCDWLSEAELFSAIHTAQVRSVEPCIEYGRVWLLTQLKSRLKAILPFDDEYGNHYEHAMDMEFRHLIYYRDRIAFKANERKALELLYESRNCISHLGILEYAKLDVLLRCAMRNEWNALGA